MVKYLLLPILLITGLFAQTEVSGNISGNWTTTGSPYIVTGNLLLLPEDTLTIDPGVEVRFDGNYKFDVFGTLFAVGTEGDSISFVSNAGGTWMSMRGTAHSLRWASQMWMETLSAWASSLPPTMCPTLPTVGPAVWWRLIPMLGQSQETLCLPFQIMASRWQRPHPGLRLS